jgi:hypothetical protein
LPEHPRFLPLLAFAVPKNDVLTRTSFGIVVYFIIASYTSKNDTQNSQTKPKTQKGHPLEKIEKYTQILVGKKKQKRRGTNPNMREKIVSSGRGRMFFLEQHTTKTGDEEVINDSPRD